MVEIKVTVGHNVHCATDTADRCCYLTKNIGFNFFQSSMIAVFNEGLLYFLFN